MTDNRLAWIPVAALSALAWALFRADPDDAPPSTPAPSANPERTAKVIADFGIDRWLHPTDWVDFVAIWPDGSKVLS